MTTYTLRKGNPAKTRTDLVVVGVTRSAKGELAVTPGAEDVAGAWGRRWRPLLASMGFKGDHGEVLRLPTDGVIGAGQLLVVGLGAQDDLTLEKVRRAAGVAARNLGNAASVALALPAGDAAHVGAVVGGFVSGSYSFTRYKSRADDTAVADVAVLSEVARQPEAVAALETARTVGALVDRARDWVNTPPNDLDPTRFADDVVALVEGKEHRKAGLGVEVLGVEELTELGCGGILGVGQGSATPPRLVTLTWEPAGADESTPSVALVGKGITYDSGGLNIKSGPSMALMKNDMGGAAAVLAATVAVAALDLPVRVTTYAAMAENMPSGSATRPGDVLTIRNGKTVEITNTDAEGRMVMADALSLAAEASPDVVVDVATLTGGCVVALGEKVAGLMGHDEPVAALQAAAATSGEMLWHLPLPEESRAAVLESKVADVLQANWVRWGGTLYAGAFLEQFVGETPWAHLDIAGPAWASSAWGHVPAGATGYGVTTLVAWVQALAAGSADS